MKLSTKIMAFLRGADPEALQEAGIGASEIEALAEPTTDTALQAQIDILKAQATSNQLETERMKAVALRSQAEAFYTVLVTPDAKGEAKAVHAQKDSIILGFELAAKADGQNFAVAFDATGQIAEGENLKAFKAGWANATPHRLFAAEIQGEKPDSKSEIRSDVVKGMMERNSRVSGLTDKVLANLPGGK